jgi:multidrug efflux pump subunit AcrA (membrane-fusion protein)
MNQMYAVGANNIVHVRTVKLGTQVGPNIVITSGLNAGEQVVTEGLDKLKDGMKVTPQADKSLPTTAAAGQNPQGN